MERPEMTLDQFWEKLAKYKGQFFMVPGTGIIRLDYQFRDIFNQKGFQHVCCPVLMVFNEGKSRPDTPITSDEIVALYNQGVYWPADIMNAADNSYRQNPDIRRKVLEVLDLQEVSL